MRDDDFFEEDEDPEKIHAAFARAAKGVTAPPPNAWTWNVLTGHVARMWTNA